MNTNKRVTIKQVGKIAGVSIPTVSKVVNNRQDVSPETRERVKKVIEDLGYRPSALARSLSQQRSYTLGVVTVGLKFIGPSRTLSGITDKARDLGYALLLEELALSETDKIYPPLQSLLARHVDGIVWAVPEVGDNCSWVDDILNDAPVPVVFLTIQPRQGVSTVSVDNYRGGVLATQHLLNQGRRQIGHVSGPLGVWEARQRKLAWQDTLKKAGIEAIDSHCAEGDWSSRSGKIAFEKLLQSYPEIDAVFVANDQMALSVLQTAIRQKIAIPKDLAVVGYDNVDESEYYWPALTTMNLDQHKLGCRAVEEVVHQIETVQHGEKIETQNIWLSPELVVRDSSVG
jgi:LacI family transcriptional regulator